MTKTAGHKQMQIDRLIEQRDADIQRAAKSIQEAINPVGPYSHNIVTLCLQDISEKYGYERANILVEHFELDVILDIEPHYED